VRRRRSRRRSTSHINRKEAIAVTAGAAAYGYLSENTEMQAFVTDKLPTLGNKALTFGLAAYFLNKHITKNRYVGHLAVGALAVGGYKLGQANFKLQGGDVGWDDAIDVTDEGEEVSGIVD